MVPRARAIFVFRLRDGLPQQGSNPMLSEYTAAPPSRQQTTNPRRTLDTITESLRRALPGIEEDVALDAAIDVLVALRRLAAYRDERPTLTITFATAADLHAFVDELISDSRTPLPDRQPAWRHVRLWGVTR
jgi:hypothetical protein